MTTTTNTTIANTTPPLLLNIHEEIKSKLDFFYSSHKIPNIIFHGPPGSGKRTLVNDFIQKIYHSDKEKIKSLVLYVDCAHGKGIKFIREELKFFAKMHIHCDGGDNFKSTILLNADNLTMDAQSALRRCIELFSHNTRFFIIVENKYTLLKPILSRFCEMYVSEPILDGKAVNLHQYLLQKSHALEDVRLSRQEGLRKALFKFSNSLQETDEKDEKEEGEESEEATMTSVGGTTQTKILQESIRLYERGYSGLDILRLIETTKFMESKMSMERRYELLFRFHQIRREIRSEKLLIAFLLHFILVATDESIPMDNIRIV